MSVDCRVDEETGMVCDGCFGVEVPSNHLLVSVDVDPEHVERCSFCGVVSTMVDPYVRLRSVVVFRV